MQTQEVSIRYDNVCLNKQYCEISFPVPLNMTRPLFMYYELTNFYQNHRRYVKSRIDSQLQGNIVTDQTDLSSCDPFIGLNGTKSPEQYIYFPCGLIAKSVFNDTLILKNDNGSNVNVTKKGIAWESDLKEKYNNPTKKTGIRIIPDLRDEEFIVWMRISALPKFRKLYRIIQEDLVGNFSVQITNNYDVSSFQGTKSIVISQTSFLGGQNIFLGIAYMAVGGVCILCAIIFLIAHLACGRKQGDLNYIAFE